MPPGRVELARAEAVIHRPSSPLMAVDLADGSSIKVQPNHAFWVENGAGFRGPGWLEAEHLRVGDQLRTASGVGVTVVGLRYNVGTADVYTLTVATDHDFFVGTARVLVHNSDVPCSGLVPYGSTELSKAVQAARIANRDKLGNYAAALLDDGTIIIGRSSKAEHAEEDLIQQAGNRQILSLYSEREPCANYCAGLLSRLNITDITWSWDWNGVNRDAINADIRQAVRNLFK